MRGAAFVLLLSLLASGASAQESGVLDKTIVADVPVQALPSALIALSAEAKVQVIMPGNRLDGVMTRGVKGRMRLRQALTILLHGTTLTFHETAPRTITITTASPPPVKRGRKTANDESYVKPESSPPVSSLQEIVVTANKRAEPLDIVPVSVSVLTSRSLDQLGADQLSDYIDYLPNVFLVGSGATGYGKIYIRGITTIGSGSTVGVYIDDAPFGSSTNFGNGGNLQPDLDPSILEQIEVLRGPQGTLYGSGSEGGMIKYVTRAPDLEQANGGLSEEFSSIDDGGDGYALRASGSVPIIPNEVALEASVYQRQDPGFIDNLATGRKNTNFNTSHGGYASLLVKPSDRLQIRFSALIQSLDAHALDSVPVGAGVDQIGGVLGPPIYGRYTTYLKDADGSQTRDSTYIGRITYDLPAFSISSTTSYSTIGNFIAYGDCQCGDDADYGINPQDTLQNSFATGTHKVTEETRLTSKTGGPFEWLLAGFYTHEKSDYGLQQFAHLEGQPDPAAAPNGDLYTQEVHSTYDEYSVFGNGTLQTWKRLYVTLGSRYSWYDQHFIEQNGGLFGNPADPTVAAVYSDNGSRDGAFTYSTDVSWRFTDQGEAYVRAASGYRVGGPTAVPLEVPDAVSFPKTFAPENLYDYELGMKRAYFSDRVAVDSSIFYIDYRDMQGNILIGRYAITGNPGNAQSVGGELTVDMRPAEGLTIASSLGFAEATLTENAPAFNAKRGDRLPDSPEVTASLTVNYERLIGNEIWASVGGGVQYASSSTGDFSSAADATYFPAAAILGLHVGLRLRDLSATLYVKNLTNTYEYENNTNFSGNGPPYVSVTPPRMIGLRLTEDF